MTVAVGLIFVATLAIIAADWVHRTKTALVGAGLLILIGALDLEEAIEAIDWATLGLLIGMMIIVGLTERTGIFTYLALRVVQVSRGRPFRLLLLVASITAVLSAFLDNLTAILLIVPITLVIADRLQISPVPLVLTEVMASNIGGMATLIGDPPNIMIGSHVSDLSFIDFIVNLAPIAVATLLVVIGFLYLLFRRQLVVAPERAAEIARFDPGRDIRESRYVKRSVAVLLGTIVVFFLHSTLGLEPAVVALLGATTLLLVAGDDVEGALERVEWSTIFFFVGLFVLVGGLEKQGIIEEVADLIARTAGGSRTAEGVAILWTAAVGSAAVDNIPFTAAMLPVVDELEAQGGAFDAGRWWALALGASLGGNATLIAAAANVAATGVLARAGHEVSFGQFLRVGIPVAIISLAIATAYLLIFHF